MLGEERNLKFESLNSKNDARLSAADMSASVLARAHWQTYLSAEQSETHTCRSRL